MMNWIRNYLRSASFKRAARTAVIAFAAILLPGALGWLHGLTEWANSQGQAPFPDASSLAYLGVSAIAAAVIAVGNLLWNAVEDWSGKGFLRDPGVDK